MEIKGKRVLITGANRGLGRALALACIGAGAGKVFAGTRNVGALEASGSSKIIPIKLDVTSNEDVASAYQRLGRVDILINNAGIAVYGGVFNAAFEDIQREIDINILGPLRVVRAFAPAMAEHGEGLIVNVSSQLGKVALPATGTYCATKAALLSLTQAMRGDLAHRGVRVIAVLPGAMDTDMTRNYDIPKTSPSKVADEILEAIKTEPREIAVSDDARKLLSDLAADPVSVEESLSGIRA
jgi:NAD(P)-dependent dehydrogenase (short-subunit alcohol dehydrogenase family)